MRTRPLQIAVCLVLSSGLALAQAPGEKPKPGPEHKRLGYFVGKWTAEAEMKPSPFMPGGKMMNHDTCGRMDMVTVPRGTVQDGSWVYNDEAKMGGRFSARTALGRP